MHTYINGVTLNKSNNKKQSGGVVSHYCTNSNRLYLLQLRIDDSKKNKKILYNFCWFCQLLALPCLFLHLLRVHQGRGGWENNGRCFPHLASSIQHMTSAIQIDASKVCLRIEVQVRGVQGSSVDDGSLPQKVASKPEVRRLWNGPCECKCVLGLKCVFGNNNDQSRSPTFPLWWVMFHGAKKSIVYMMDSWIQLAMHPHHQMQNPQGGPPIERGLSRQDSAARCCTAQGIFVTDISWFPENHPRIKFERLSSNATNHHQIKGHFVHFHSRFQFRRTIQFILNSGRICPMASEWCNFAVSLLKPASLFGPTDPATSGSLAIRSKPRASRCRERRHDSKASPRYLKGKKIPTGFLSSQSGKKKTQKKTAQTGDFVMDVGENKRFGTRPWNSTWRMVCHIMTRDLSTLDIDPCNLDVLPFHLRLFGVRWKPRHKTMIFLGGHQKSARKMPPKKTNMSPRLFFSMGICLFPGVFGGVCSKKTSHVSEDTHSCQWSKSVKALAAADEARC